MKRRDRSERNTVSLNRDDPPKTMSVTEAGKRYFNLGKNGSYQAAHSGQIPVIKIGGRYRVSVAALERMLVEAGSKPAP